MNLRQLVALWYGGIATTAILLFRAVADGSSLLLIGAILVLTALAIYTARPHPGVSALRLFKFVLIPPVAILTAAILVALGVGFFNRAVPEPDREITVPELIRDEPLLPTSALVIPTESVSLSDLRLKTGVPWRDQFSGDLRRDSVYLEGKIKNASDIPLSTASLRVVVRDDDGDVQSETAHLESLAVPSGEVRYFNATIQGMSLPPGRWSFSCTVESAEGRPLHVRSWRGERSLPSEIEIR